MSGLISIDEARAAVLARIALLPEERVALAAAGGRVLAEPGTARTDLPPFDTSAMDGFAVRAQDTPGRLRVSGDSAAGRPAAAAVGAGQAIGISTGAVVPTGADAIVPVEQVVVEGETVTVEAANAGDHIRPRGGDVRRGETVLPAGTLLGPPQLGALAAAGVAELMCTRRPRVTILATGSELVQPGAELGPGQIYESNGTLLAAQARSAGAEVTVLERVLDDERETRAGLAAALDTDVLLTSGGVSVGPHDLVRGLLPELGVEQVFWGVAVRPGKPLFFGVRDATLVFGLPGNPVSTLVGFELFVRPALAALQGAAPGPVWLPGTLAGALRQNAARDDLVRAVARDDGSLAPVTGQESHMIVRAAAANALVLVPRGEGELRAGDHVSWLRV